MIHPYDVLVIGGGISGMAASVAAARRGGDVLLLEGADSVGKKAIEICAGSCAITNEQVSAENYYDADPDFVLSVLKHFTNKDLKTWLEEIGLDLKSENGRISPVSGQTMDVLDILRLQMNRHFVRVEPFQKVIEIEKTPDELFEVRCVRQTYYGKRVILAAGSKALAQTDSGDAGYRLAQEFGMKVKKPLPAMTHLRLSAPYTSDWDGICCDGAISLLVDGQEVASGTGTMELTAYGLTGEPAFMVSRYAARALDEGKDVSVRLSFLPGKTAEEAYEFLTARIERVKEYLARDILIGVIPKKLARMLIRQAGIRHSRPISYLKEAEVRKLAEVLIGLAGEVTGHGNFRQSQICSGGVLTSELDPETLESHKVKGLYLAGELIDVDGMCGGYNLQWSFSSGFTAGIAAADD